MFPHLRFPIWAMQIGIFGRRWVVFRAFEISYAQRNPKIKAGRAYRCMLVFAFLGVWRVLFVCRWRSIPHPSFVALIQEDRNIYARNDTWAMGRFPDIIIAMYRV